MSLNLVPDPKVMAVQAGLFLLNFYAVKKLLLEPYLEVRARRLKATIGSQTEAELLEKQNLRSLETIRTRIAEASIEARSYREQVILAAKQKRDDLLARAHKEANDTIQAMRAELAENISEQKQSLPRIVEQLSEQFTNRLVPN